MMNKWKSFLALALAAGLSAGAAEVVVRPTDDGRALVNPDMGWTMHYYSNVPANYGSLLEPGDDCAWFPGCSTVYLRMPWAYLEPAEGVYNWAALDTPAQRWIARGGQVAFRITCSESWLKYATPAWVKEAGAKGVFWTYGKGLAEDGHCWDPDFVDPVFLEKLPRYTAYRLPPSANFASMVSVSVLPSLSLAAFTMAFCSTARQGLETLSR